METKRCAYCHKLQRADAHICSGCGHMFVRKQSRTFSKDLSYPSLPPASPHRAGHYSGLHPEDQPYQSSKIVPTALLCGRSSAKLCRDTSLSESSCHRSIVSKMTTRTKIR